ncbi:hypothetical protein ElyMa_004653900 [Elysia marginata]|uniref:Uncharacterized protein n=1 Tax=Elysia marginata TaxID=1093978 RepID=A0AAV4I3W4_9GAST|nr:hypothetical protein ElyMa_004653900 [Elysia marginata]
MSTTSSTRRSSTSVLSKISTSFPSSTTLLALSPTSANPSKPTTTSPTSLETTSPLTMTTQPLFDFHASTTLSTTPNSDDPHSFSKHDNLAKRASVRWCLASGPTSGRTSTSATCVDQTAAIIFAPATCLTPKTSLKEELGCSPKKTDII